MQVALIDYGSGNLHSAHKAMERAARDNTLAANITVTADPAVIARADRLVLPGVGAFKDCRAGIEAVPGLWEAIKEAVSDRGRPFLGICVGMQLMATRGLEHEETPGFGWILGDVVRLRPEDNNLKIPHMGWNTVTALAASPLFAGIPMGDQGLHAYFVHSYHLQTVNSSDRLAVADYGGDVTAAVQRDNMAGVQFHPEKSQAFGLAFLANFMRWSP